MLDIIEDKVKERLIKYLSRDGSGIRKVVLGMFLSGTKYTTNNIYNYLIREKYQVSYRGVSAIVGLMNTRLGILSINVTGEHNVYSLKENYREVVKILL